MKTQFYLITNARGSVRTTKTNPDLKWDEVAVHLSLDLPQILFQRPQLQGSINVKESQVLPHKIDVDVINNIQESIKQHTGVMVDLRIIEGE